MQGQTSPVSSRLTSPPSLLQNLNLSSNLPSDLQIHADIQGITLGQPDLDPQQLISLINEKDSRINYLVQIQQILEARIRELQNQNQQLLSQVQSRNSCVLSPTTQANSFSQQISPLQDSLRQHQDSVNQSILTLQQQLQQQHQQLQQQLQELINEKREFSSVRSLNTKRSFYENFYNEYRRLAPNHVQDVLKLLKQNSLQPPEFHQQIQSMTGLDPPGTTPREIFPSPQISNPSAPSTFNMNQQFPPQSNSINIQSQLAHNYINFQSQLAHNSIDFQSQLARNSINFQSQLARNTNTNTNPPTVSMIQSSLPAPFPFPPQSLTAPFPSNYDLNGIGMNLAALGLPQQ